MKKLFIISIIVLILCISVHADDEYKPYLHKAFVPEHPKLELYGTYNTNLFPGAATYSYPINVPKGTNGFTPSLAISYNHQTVRQRPGILGAGWSLNLNYIYRDINATFENKTDDIFKLVFDNALYELVYVNGQYHTKTETYLKIQNLSTTSNTYGMYWTLTQKDGTRYRFGYNPESELVSNLEGNHTVKWSLDLIEDTHGNKIYYSYDEDPSAEDFGTAYLKEMSYNNDEQRKIKFSYENSERPDKRVVYENGLKLYESRRLEDIIIFAEDNLVRRYHLDYANLNEIRSLSSISRITYYGSDNSSVIHNVNFEYYNDTPGYTKLNETYIPSELFTAGNHLDYGVRIIDFNNDGFIDVVKSRPGYANKSLQNTRNGSWVDSDYQLPVSITTSSDIDNGVRFADLNGDGFVDVIHSRDGTRGAYLNNGSGWNYSAVWRPLVGFIGAGNSNGTILVDVNGDGKTDILQSNPNAKNVWMNNGNGWTRIQEPWVSPAELVDANYKDVGVRFVDLNNDGLPDILRATDIDGQKQDAWLNDGSGWTSYPDFSPPANFTTIAKTDNGLRISDINGDGLPDLLEDYENVTRLSRVWANNGSGWVLLDIDWHAATSFTLQGFNIGRRLGDVNGDGFADIIISYEDVQGQHRFTYQKNSTNSYLLKRIINEYGGVIEINYSGSTSLNSSGSLGFNTWLVSSYQKNNSLSDFNASGNYFYSYSGGLYDYSEQEFRGFNIVNETIPDNSLLLHYFHQDDVLKGKEYRTEIYNSSVSLFSKTEKGYDYTNGSYYEIFLRNVTDYLFDGQDEAVITRTDYDYDNYGNLITKITNGDTSFTGDEKYEYFSYLYNNASWIVDKTGMYELYGEDNSTLAKKTEYAYDSNTFGVAPSKGDLTKVREWNSESNDIITEFEYDSYGNLIEQTDGRGYRTKYKYGIRDTTFTYADKVINALGHYTDYEYDLGSGNLLWEEKEEIRREYEYDVFGRIEKEIMPYDSLQLPTREYEYDLDGTAPERIIIKQRETGGNYTQVEYYYDGFAQLVQIKSLIEENESVVKNIFYDAQGRVKQEQNPYIESYTESLSTPSILINKTYYYYDVLDRVVNVTNPDSTSKKIVFNKWTISDYDENNHRHDYLLDGQGRIINVVEYNLNPLINNWEETYNTSYEYDSQDNLIRITDNEGNEFEFSYDSLGRKIKLEDPDLGTWKYEYDSNGNLIRQTDNRINNITLSYDALNRIAEKNGTGTHDVNITFEYDSQYWGTLANITQNGNSIRFTYDKRLRLIQEEQYAVNRWLDLSLNYDSMNRIIEKASPYNDLDYFYNKQGRIRKISNYLTGADYNAFGSILNKTYNNGLTSVFSYKTSNNRLTGISTGTVQNLAYSYDNIGNIMSIIDSIQSRNYSMGYDSLDRLINTTINNDLYQYEYSSIGNIKRIAHAGSAKRLVYNSDKPHAPSEVIEDDAGAGIYNANQIQSNSKNRTFEFWIVKELLNSVNGVNLSLNFGDGTISGETINVSSPVMAIVRHNYTNAGEYDVNFSTDFDRNKLRDKFGIDAQSLSLITSNASFAYMEFIIEKDIDEKALNANWNCTNGISSDITFNITNSTFVFIEYNYTTSGDKEVICSVTSDDGSGNKTAEFEMKGLEIQNYTITELDSNKKQVSFNIRNYWWPLTAEWNIKSDSTIITDSVDLNTSDIIKIVRNITYTADGYKTVDINATSDGTLGSYLDEFLIQALEIENYDRYAFGNTTRIIVFDVYNHWPENLSVSWNITELSLENSSDLTQNQSVMVIIEEDYVAQGHKQPEIKAYSGSFLSTLKDSFRIYIVEIFDFQILKQSLTSTVAELLTRTNSGNKTIDWRYDTGDTGEAVITSNQSIVLNETASVMILIESNYTSEGVYSINASINSSQHTDEARGVVSNG